MTERRRFEGKTAVITGAAQGIGRERGPDHGAGRREAGTGGPIAIWSTRSAQEIAAAGGEAFAATADLETYAVARGDGAWARTSRAGSTFS